MLNVVILAAGKGTRMRSDTPKILHTLAGKPFLQHVIDRARELSADNIYVVVGHGADMVCSAMGDEELTYVEQTEQLGTGHAVLQVLPYLDAESNTLILYGDVPLIAAATLGELVQHATESSLGLLTVTLENPHGYGRIVRDASGNVTAIVEEKDTTDQEKSIREVNTGVMVVPSKDLHRWLPSLSDDNAQGEFLLPDIIAMAKEEGKQVKTSQPKNADEVLGVNNRQQQAHLERTLQRQIAEELMAAGLSLLDPDRFDCRGSLRVGKDCVIDVNCVFEGDVVLGDNVCIGPNCHIKNATVGDNVDIKSHTVIENAELARDVSVGPFARLRPGAKLESEAKVGNFVEIKKAIVGRGSKVSHLSYIGDAELGEDVNIGAGTITCNYDGVNKFTTTIGDGVFVGSNTALVAPVELGENVTIGAGSVITTDVKTGALAVSRARQKNIDGWVRPTKK